MEGMFVTGVELTHDALHRIIETAVEAGRTNGFGYWAKLISIGENGAGKYTSVTLKEHGDGPEFPGKKKTIKEYDIKRGIVLMINAGSSFDEDRIDGPLCESVLQYAMFGEQKYS